MNAHRFTALLVSLRSWLCSLFLLLILDLDIQNSTMRRDEHMSQVKDHNDKLSVLTIFFRVEASS